MLEEWVAVISPIALCVRVLTHLEEPNTPDSWQHLRKDSWLQPHLLVAACTPAPMD